MEKLHESVLISFSSDASLGARSEIFQTLKSYPATDEETERSLGLFIRGSLLARIFAIADIYKQIVEIPGAIFDVGTWRGQTAVLCENFRAIFEPLNFGRRVVCFDTFEGYQGFADKDKPTEIHREGTYTLRGGTYADFLSRLLALHEQSNAMGHNSGKHRVVQGDCRETIPKFLAENPNEYVALAFFDVNSYDPTQKAFEQVWARLVPGGIAAFWQLTRNTIPAEGRVYTEKILPAHRHTVRRSLTYPGLCYLVKS